MVYNNDFAVRRDIPATFEAGYRGATRPTKPKGHLMPKALQDKAVIVSGASQTRYLVPGCGISSHHI